ncbi:hypothetical protein [Cohaesibacter marisflavi]|uniref:hypothetical protein n=1 Tax=Cohaesibacter marisflavi TaxID=655353 RepID=UPI0029C648FC|nr:hypothetical protein [Cohaesibacter marisflavi]
MGCSDGAPRIAGDLTTEDWFTREELLKGNAASADDWQKAVNDFFKERVRKRYLNPIGNLQNGDGEGEGFAIVTIQCALIEFLAALRKGAIYEFHEPDNAKHEYNDSRKLFVDFLRNTPPFSESFSRKQAEEFYSSIRCGLLHEAQSKGGWRIRNVGLLPVDHDTKTLNRDSFHRIIETYIDKYVEEIKTSKDRQDAFIRKFNHICKTAQKAPRQAQ